MRRASTCLAVLGLALLALPGVASAVPTVNFKAEAVPIPGYKGTGNILGAGAAVETEYKIEGKEYFGSPPPIIGVNFYLPKGTVLHPSGFPTCSQATVEQIGPIGCSKASQAGPIGTALGYVTLGGERVEETTEIFSFYKTGGGFIFFTEGHSTGVAGNPLPRPLQELRGRRRLRPRARSHGAGDRERAGRAVRVGQDDQSQGRLGDRTEEQPEEGRPTTVVSRRRARKAASRSRPK